MKKLHLICNAHLDPVWQWDWREGAAAAAATFSRHSSKAPYLIGESPGAFAIPCCAAMFATYTLFWTWMICTFPSEKALSPSKRFSPPFHFMYASFVIGQRFDKERTKPLPQKPRSFTTCAMMVGVILLAGTDASPSASIYRNWVIGRRYQIETEVKIVPIFIVDKLNIAFACILFCNAFIFNGKVFVCQNHTCKTTQYV